MKLRKAIKQIMALGAGATMVGATVLSALAADLSTYPAPFVKDGAYSALIVVGAAAKTADVLGSVDIGMGLQYANSITKTIPGTATTVTLTGDSFKLSTSSNFLEKDEELDSLGITRVTSSDMTALKSGSLANSKGTYAYNQYITLPSSANITYADVSDEEDFDGPGWYMYYLASSNVYVYSIEFPTAAESDITSLGVLDDFEDKTLTLMGKSYTIVDADMSSLGVKMSLMGGAVTDVLDLTETKTYTIGGKDYEVTLSFVDATHAKFAVNGEVTDLMVKGDTYTLADKTEIGVREVLYQSFAGGVMSSEFFLGASKIVLEDTNMGTAVTGDQKVEVGSNTVKDVTSTITGSNTSTVAKISSITMTWTPTSAIYVPLGKGVMTYADDDQDFLNFDIKFEGIEEDSSVTTIDLKAKGDDEYLLKFKNMDGKLLEIPYLDSDSGVLRAGDENYDLVYKELPINTTHGSAAIHQNDYFVVSDSASKNTYLMRYEGSDASEDQLEFENVAEGTSTEITYSGTVNTTTANANLQLGGKTFGVIVDSDADNSRIVVDLDGDGTFNETDVPTWYTQYEATIDLNAVVGNFTLTTETLDDGAATETIIVGAVGSTDSPYINIKAVTFQGGETLTEMGDTDKYYAYNRYGVKVVKDDKETGADELTMTYPDDQTAMAVFVTSGATTSTSSTGGATYLAVQRIDVGASVLDTEVTDYKAQNTIVVGGPCVNTIAAALLANPADCTTGFTEGKAKIKLFEHTNGNVALLVAGYSAMDTRRAARALANYNQYAFTGKEVEVSGTSLSQITVGTPSQ